MENHPVYQQAAIESAGGESNQQWRPPKAMMIVCPLFMAMQLLVPLLLLRRLSRIERALKTLRAERQVTLQGPEAEA